MQIIKDLIIELETHLKREFNISSSTMSLSVDKEFSKVIFFGKKVYCGVVEGKLYSRGIDYLKTSTLQYASKLQKDLIERILFKNQLSFHSIIQEYKDGFYNKVFDESNIKEITLFQRVTKRPEKYVVKNTPALVAKWMIDNKMLFYPGLMVEIIATGFKDGKMEGCHPLSNLWKGKIDKNYIWCHQILPKLSRITEVLSPVFDWKQFDPQIVEQRNKKIIQYEKWLMDSRRNEHVIEKIKNDVVLSDLQKKDLISFASKSRTKSLW